jgi:hypothetical protein
LFGAAKGHDDGGDHHRAKGHDARRTRQSAFFFKQVFLDGIPARAAKLLGPTRAQPTFRAQNFGPTLQIIPREAEAVVDFVGNVGRQMLAHPSAYLLAELLFFGRESQIHECLLG